MSKALELARQLTQIDNQARCCVGPKAMFLSPAVRCIRQSRSHIDDDCLYPVSYRPVLSYTSCLDYCNYMYIGLSPTSAASCCVYRTAALCVLNAACIYTSIRRSAEKADRHVIYHAWNLTGNRLHVSILRQSQTSSGSLLPGPWKMDVRSGLHVFGCQTHSAFSPLFPKLRSSELVF